MSMMKTALLLAVLTALFMAVGYAIGGRTGMTIAFFVALAHECLQLLEFRQNGAGDEQRSGGGRKLRP